ncbi:acetylornithine deacetylase [Leuconostoc carnosum]|uniref:acetylornithine deacetylase n=1 Tax=Leuconostoc carnosum TaxID=1252 RepID=UPI00123923F1|nr:acetylornithine deacetylase [Leuconostoc carnosum]KAA8370885.1 acetylornithine deacetylase [Leuconostoc carnosum]KAA8382527.1 acetylornithine deacetylase [Leuconostoc carnosum]
MDLTEVNRQIETRQGELLDLVARLVAFETPAPPARNTREAQNFVADFLRPLGFDIDQWALYENDDIVVGTKAGDPTCQSLIINGHMDVAALNPDEKWTFSPFEAVVHDGRVIGRGVSDMKGGLAAALFALKILHDQNIALPGKILFESVIGEEVGEAGTKSTIDHGYTADFALVTDSSDLEIRGQGGVITGWVTIKSDKTYHDGLRREMIHAGGGLRAASAIEKMAKLIIGLQELERDWAVNKTYPGFPAGTNTINPAVVEGGRNAAFIADEARLWITVHFYPNETYQSVTSEVESFVTRLAQADPWLRDHLPTFEWGGSSMIEDRGEIFPSLEVDEKHAAVQTLLDAHLGAFGEKTKLSVSTSVTDGGWFGDAHIPAAIYGPGDLRNAHAVDESISIERLVQYSKSLAQFIVAWTHTKKE